MNLWIRSVRFCRAKVTGVTASVHSSPLVSSFFVLSLEKAPRYDRPPQFCQVSVSWISFPSAILFSALGASASHVMFNAVMFRRAAAVVRYHLVYPPPFRCGPWNDAAFDFRFFPEQCNLICGEGIPTLSRLFPPIFRRCEEDLPPPPTKSLGVTFFLCLVMSTSNTSFVFFFLDVNLPPSRAIVHLPLGFLLRSY